MGGLKNPEIKKCEWCHREFPCRTVGNMTGQRFCSIDCRYEAKKARERIFTKYFFDSKRAHEEVEKLRVQGKEYVLPED